MRVKVQNKEIEINDELIAKYCKSLEITEEEAIQMYLEDERIP